MPVARTWSITSNFVDDHQKVKMFRWSAWNCHPLFLIDTAYTSATHEITHWVTADQNAITGKLVINSAATTAGILQVNDIDLGNDPQSWITERNWLAVVTPCISKEVRSYQRNQGVQPMNNETDLRRTISWWNSQTDESAQQGNSYWNFKGYRY